MKKDWEGWEQGEAIREFRDLARIRVWVQGWGVVSCLFALLREELTRKLEHIDYCPTSSSNLRFKRYHGKSAT